MADMRTVNKPTVAMGKEFMSNLSNLPKNALKNVNKFLSKFQENPRSSGINLERVNNAVDEKMYSARVDQRYRVIIAFQKSSNVYILLYVGDHDDAYKWAETKRLNVNQTTRSIQLYDDLTLKEQEAALRG